jgi:hypothetical protein
MAASDEVIKLLLDMGVSKDNVQAVVAKLKDLEAETTKAAVGLDKVKTSAGNSGQSLLQTGRVIQDFAQGGLGGILNNIEGLTMALGLGSGLAGILTVLGVVALTAGPAIKSFFQGIIDGSNEVPESKDKLEALNNAIKANAKELDGLKDKQVLTNTELARFNELTTKQIKLEKEAAAAKAQRKKEEDFDAQRPAGEAKHENAQAEAMKAMVGTPKGRQQEMIEETGAALLANRVRKWEAEYNALPARDEQTPEQSRRERQLAGFISKDQRGEFKGSADPLAKEYLARATAGDEKALNALMNSLPEGSTTREILRLASPRELEAQRVAKGGAEEDRAKGKAAEAAKAKQAAADEAGRLQQAELDERGRKNIKAGEAKAEIARKKAHDEIAEDVKKRGDEDLKRVYATDVDERARSRAGILAAQGGVQDKYERFHPLNAKQQQRYNANLTERDIKQRFPELAAGDRTGIANRTATEAGQAVREEIRSAQVSAIQAGFTTDQALAAGLQTTLQRLKVEEQKANVLTRDIRAMQRDTTQTRPTGAMQGRGN